MSSATTHKASEALGLWEPKRTLTLEAARRHSGRIRRIRQFLYAVSAFLVLILVWQFASQGQGPIMADNPEQSVKMINPRFSGRTEDGLPYYLTSSEAIRTQANENEVELIDPVLEFYREEGAEISTVVADRGTYDDVSKVLNLRVAVDLNTDDGNQCKTTHARIFTKTKTIEGDEPIDCVGSFGEVSGNAYEILNNYKTFVFKNGMSAVLDQSTPQAPLQPDELTGGDDEN